MLVAGSILTCRMGWRFNAKGPLKERVMKSCAADVPVGPPTPLLGRFVAISGNARPGTSHEPHSGAHLELHCSLSDAARDGTVNQGNFKFDELRDLSLELQTRLQFLTRDLPKPFLDYRIHLICRLPQSPVCRLNLLPGQILDDLFHPH